MALAGTLEIQMLANMAQLKEDMRTAQNVVGGAMKNVESAVASAKTALAGLGAGLSVGAFVALVQGSINAMDHLNDLSKTTDIAVEKLAGLKLAAKQSGSDLDSIAAAINKLAQNMGKDDVAGKFKALGVSAKDPLEAFKQLADVFVSIKDPQLRAAVAAEALGKSWAGAAPLLAEGGKKIGEMQEKGTRLSKITKEMAEAADLFNDSMAELSATSQGALAKMIGPMLGGFTDVVKAIQLAYEESGKLKAAWVGLGALGQFLFTDDFLSKSVKVNREIGVLNVQISALIKQRDEISRSTGPLGNFLPELDMKIREAQVKVKLLQLSLPQAPAAAKKPDPAAEAAAAKAAREAEERARAFLALNKEMDEKYKALNRTVQDAIAIGAAELDGRAKLTDAQKIAMKAMVDLRDGTITLTSAQKRELAGNLERLLQIDKEIEDRKKLIEVYKSQAEYAKFLTDEEERRDAVIAGANTANSQALKDIELETELIRQEAAANGAGLLLKQDELRLMSDVALARETAIQLRKIDLELERQILALGPNTSEENNKRIEELYAIAAAQKAALPDALAAREAAKLANDLARNNVSTFQSMWASVESTGRNVWTIMTAGGKGMAESVGKAIKSSIYDLLYQMTIRPFIIQIGASIAGSMGIASAAQAAGGIGSGIGGIGNLFSMASSASSLFGGGGTGGMLSGLLGSPSVGLVDVMGTGLAGTIEGTGLLGAMGGAGAGLAAALPWIGGALAIGGALGLFGGGGGPKAQSLYWGGGNFGADNITSQNPAFYSKVDAYSRQLLNDYTPEQLQRLNGISVQSEAGTDENQLFGQLQQAVNSALAGIKSISQTAAETAAWTATLDTARQSLRAAQDPTAFWAAQIAKLQAQLGTNAGTIEEWRAQFLKALDTSPGQEQFTAWQALGNALDQAAKSATKATAAVAELSAESFSTLVDYTRYQRLVANGIAVDGRGRAVPRFASGGLHGGGGRIVGENGPEFEITGPSRIVSNSELGQFFDVSALVGEIRQLRSDLESQNTAIAVNTGAVARLARRWDRDGLGVRGVDPTLPLEVNVVQSVPVATA